MSVKVIKKADDKKVILHPQQILMRLMAMASILKDGAPMNT